MPKFCECGCGGLAPIAPCNWTKWRWVKGEPLRFIKGHGLPKRPKVHSGYKQYGGKNARVKAHRLRAERALGRPLPPGAQVHHADGSKDELAPLVICQSKAYHILLHARMRVVAAGGNPNTERVCCSCRKPKAFDLFNRNCGRCRMCERARDAARRRPEAKPKNKIRSDCGALA